jgi:SAM-dependent methyltransferase
MSVAPLPRCRFCRAPLTTSFVDLGETPLANSYVTPADVAAGRDARYPLHARVCASCFLVQVDNVAAPEAIFSDYAYFSSMSDSWVAHARRYAEAMIARFGLGRSSQVIEIASNDGYLLQHFIAANVPALGVEPAANVAASAIAKGVPTEVAFFGRATAKLLVERGLSADLTAANNVLAHVPDIRDFVGGFAVLLKPEGVATFEFPHLLNLIRHVQFDTIYHEHFSYFSLTAVRRLFLRHGLRIIDVEHLTIHGGSLRIFASPEATSRGESVAVRAMLEAEQAAGLAGIAYYRDFSARVDRLKHNLKALLNDLKAAGRRVAAYGASAKGSTLLNTFEIGHEQIAFVVDRSSYKQGRYTPGTHLPIFAPSKLLEAEAPDYLLLLTWNFEAEILAQQAEYRARGGRFIVPIPQLRIV